MTYYVDMDGVIANFHKEPYKYTNAISREWIANLDPFTYNIEIIRNLILAKHTVYILSKSAHENAKLGKLDWLRKYLPEIPAENIIIIVGNGKKIDYMREEGILIDDDAKNTRPWVKAGYSAILLESKGALIKI